ncbi:sodium-dependent transporter [Sphingomonas canadensis]|uniref:Transporter n=1 Tax=Sphingomonas canadensis TaxID=1219257 RepID=A0ABW3H6Q3_9SPHN|nr:sodium-dependent transporter [Sphingomonas canadensis]MCW3836192.1 sodium-dependent transporter [Sphingomonas canadensis]
MAATNGGQARQHWSSRFAFLYSTIAASVGLGSLWRFPYVAGANGGGAFVLVYIAFLLILGTSVAIAEMMIGKRGQGSTVASVDALVAQNGSWRAWRVIGWLSLFIPFLGLSYYSVVAGWSIDYARIAIWQGFGTTDAAESLAAFNAQTAAPLHQAIMQIGFIFGIAFVVAQGLHAGIETISRIKMIALSGVLLVLIVYNAVFIGLGDTIVYLFKPDFARLTFDSVIAALGQAIFSLGIGIGVLMTFGSFLPAQASLPQSAFGLTLGILIATLISAVAIFPIVLHYGSDPQGGANLVFVAMPLAFSQMPGGRLLAILFFLLLALSALTCAVAMLQPVVSWLEERLSLGRKKLCALAAVVLSIVGLPSLLSFSLLADFHPLSWIRVFREATVFNILDFGVANILLPLNALLIALFVAWAMRNGDLRSEFKDEPALYLPWRLIVGIATPLAIVGLMATL